MQESVTSPRKGGGFLLDASPNEDVFTPEDFSEEHELIREMTRQFVEAEVVPRVEEIESKDWELTTALLRRCGELGLLGIEVPEKYGGESLDKVSAMIVQEELGRVGSFAVSYGAQAGIGTLPIVYFGTEEQKLEYLPRFCKAEIFTSYALSEAASGSDALAARTRACKSADGKHWILSGEKMWITNAAFADVFVTFAQVDGDKFSCFIVERKHPGVSVGAEEKKMGLLGSSTSTVILDNAQVPSENLLGEIGKGHRVAFNILNTGRAKLGANAVGGSKTALNDSIRYAKERVAFTRPIASFGAIQHKLAEMAIRIWITEAMVYRTAGLMDAGLEEVDHDQSTQVMKAIEEYAVECSILKVFGTEVLDYVVDEAVQIYGGYGYSKEYDVERYYRDSRVNRIFEGTNEINRLLIPTMLLKRAQSGALPLMEATAAAVDSTLAGSPPAASEGNHGLERAAAEQARTASLFIAGSIMKKHGADIRDQQEVLTHLSNMVMETYAIDTALCRLSKKGNQGFYPDIVRTFITDATMRLESAGRQALASVSHGGDLTDRLAALRRVLAWVPTDTVAARRRIAEALIDGDRYCL